VDVHCFDLLAPKEKDTGKIKKLEVRETPKGETVVDGLSCRQLHCIEDAVDASRNRSTAKTAMNSQSSRSHSICTLQLKIVTLISSTSNSSIGGKSTVTSKLVCCGMGV
jgi:hypothetical protein